MSFCSKTCSGPFLLWLPILLLCVGAGSAEAQITPNYPDTCTSAYTPGTIIEESVPRVGEGLTLHYTELGARDKKVVLIVNGNSYHLEDYDVLADHLAVNGFLAARVERPSNGTGGDGAFVLDALDATLDAYGIARNDPDLRVGLVGHSRGGGLIGDAAVLNDADDLGFPIRALAALSPTSSNHPAIDGTDVGDYLVIYGSQDEDLAGRGNLNEAFQAYDRAGTEGTTTCNQPPCFLLSPPIEKTMIFVHGADHAGLIGKPVHFTTLPLPQDLEFIHADDQLCIVKAYVTGFLRYKLLGRSIYKGLLRGQWQPLSVQNIDSFVPDAMGNPAGSPLRQYFQFSPDQRRALVNFESGLGSWGASSLVVVQHRGSGTLTGSPHFLRHETDLALVGWEASNNLRWAGWLIPSSSTNASTYTHLSIRLGQFDASPVPYDNPEGQEQSVWLVVQDTAGQLSWNYLQGIAVPDRSTGDAYPAAHSVMQTFRVPISTIDNAIDVSSVRAVYLVFDNGSRGALMVDNIEWHRD